MLKILFGAFSDLFEIVDFENVWFRFVENEAHF